MNNFLLIVASILVLVLAALFAVPPMIDWNDYRGAFEEEASRLLDREVRVRGDVNVRLLPVPYVSFEKVRIADAPGIPGSIARAEQFKMWLSVPPLLRGAIEARQIELEQPVIRLRTAEDGTGNWRKLQIKGELAFIPKSVTLNSVHITDGTLLLESYQGLEIAKLPNISGEMTATTLRGPYKFIGSFPIGGTEYETRVSTASMDANGDVRFSGSARTPDNRMAHTINGTLFDLLGKARAEGQLTSRARPGDQQYTAKRERLGYELTSDIKLDAEALRLGEISISFLDQERQQTLKGAATTSWQDGVVTETRLAASWLDLDAIAGKAPGDGPLEVLERLVAGGIEPLGIGVTSLEITVDQANFAGTPISDISGHMVRRDGVTKIEALRASLPGQSALAVDGYVEDRDGSLQFDGSVLTRSASLADLAQWLQLPMEPAAAERLAISFSLSGGLRVRAKAIELTEARVALADTVVEGRVSYDWNKRPVLQAEVDTNALDMAMFGDGVLAPERVAAYLGLNENATAGPAHTWLADRDIALRLRAGRLSDGIHHFRGVDIDLVRQGDVLDLTKFDIISEPGLGISLTGRLAGSAKAKQGSVSGTVAAANDGAGERLSDLLGLISGRSLPLGLTQGRTPLRLAINADIGKAGETTEARSRIVADGMMGPDRVRIDATTYGPPGGWLEQAAQIEGRITGKDAMSTVQRLLGQPAAATVDDAGDTGPVTVIITAAGIPQRTIKAYVRVDGDSFLGADFSGDARVTAAPGDDAPLEASWEGELTFRHATARSLARVMLPGLSQHVSDNVVKGAIGVTGKGDTLAFELRDLRIGAQRLAGSLKWDTEAQRLAGNLAASQAALGSLARLLMRPGATPAASPDSPDGIWPDTPFDFSHLAGFNSALDVRLDALTFDGGQLNNVGFRLSSGPDSVSLQDFAARYGSATIAGSADFLKSQAGVSLNAKVSAGAIKLTDFAPEAAGERVAGSARLDLSMAGQALSPRSLATVISGSGTIKLEGATVPGMRSETLSVAARKVIDGELELEALPAHLAELVGQDAVELGGPSLKVTLRNGTLALPAIVFEQDSGGLRNQTILDLPTLRFDSQWTITPAPEPKPDAPEQLVALPSISLVYAGTLGEIDATEGRLALGDLERELIVRKMEANVARLEQLRREDEERAAAERERQRVIEEEQRRSIEVERKRIESERAQPTAPVDTNAKPGQTDWSPKQIQPPTPEPARPGAAPANQGPRAASEAGSAAGGQPQGAIRIEPRVSRSRPPRPSFQSPFGSN